MNKNARYYVHGLWTFATLLSMALGYILGETPTLPTEVPAPPVEASGESLALRSPHAMHETEVCKILAADLGGQTEYRLQDGARVDILTDEYAIEVDWAPKWAESIGQAMYYSDQTNRAPLALLLITDDGDERFVKRALCAVDGVHVSVWTYDMRTQKFAKRHTAYFAFPPAPAAPDERGDENPDLGLSPIN